MQKSFKIWKKQEDARKKLSNKIQLPVGKGSNGELHVHVSDVTIPLPDEFEGFKVIKVIHGVIQK